MYMFVGIAETITLMNRRIIFFTCFGYFALPCVEIQSKWLRRLIIILEAKP